LCGSCSNRLRSIDRSRTAAITRVAQVRGTSLNECGHGTVDRIRTHAARAKQMTVARDGHYCSEIRGFYLRTKDITHARRAAHLNRYRARIRDACVVVDSEAEVAHGT